MRLKKKKQTKSCEQQHQLYKHYKDSCEGNKIFKAFQSPDPGSHTAENILLSTSRAPGSFLVLSHLLTVVFFEQTPEARDRGGTGIWREGSVSALEGTSKEETTHTLDILWKGK